MLNISASKNTITRGVNSASREVPSEPQRHPQTVSPSGELSPRSVNSNHVMRTRLVQLVSDEEAFGKQLYDWVEAAGPGEQRDVAAEKILNCRKENSQELSLYNLNLRTLPACIGRLTTLKELLLTQNHLEEIPEEILNLSTLKELALNNNKLKKLPADFGKLTNLTKLYLHYNHLEKIPSGLFELTALEKLSLSNNKLKTLPENISKLTNLTELFLGSNNLEEIPENLFKLTTLIELNLRSNKLEKLPEKFCELTRLTKLQLGCNNLKELPDDFFKLKALTELHVDNNKLERLPENFGEMTQLVFLNLWANKLKRLPDGFCNLTALKDLFLGVNQLEELPEKFCELKALEVLVINGMKFKTLPEGFGRMISLRHLEISEHCLPPAFYKYGPISLSCTHSDIKPLFFAICNTIDHDRRTLEQLTGPLATPRLYESIYELIQQHDRTSSAGLSTDVGIKLIDHLQLTFANEGEKEQWKAEITVLKNRDGNDYYQILPFYCYLLRALITQFGRAGINESDVAITSNAKTASGRALLGLPFGPLKYQPRVGNKTRLSTQTEVQSIEEQSITNNLVEGLNRMASINHADTPRALDATVRSITHALAYRSALHLCDNRNVSFIDIDEGNICKTEYLMQCIINAIKIPEATFNNAKEYVEPEARLEAVVTSLIAATVDYPNIQQTLLPRDQRDCFVTARALGTAHDNIIKGIVGDTPSIATGQVAPTWRNTTINAHANATIEEAQRRQAEWVRPTRPKLPALLDNLTIMEPPAGEIVSPISQRLLDKMYGLHNAEQVIDAAERLDTRTQMKHAKYQYEQVQQKNRQLERRNEQLRRDVGTLRSELQNTTAKPSDPAISLLRTDLNAVTAQQSTMQPQVNAAALQLQTLQTTVDNLPTNEQVDAIAHHVDTLNTDKVQLRRAARRTTNTVTALEEKVQTLIDKPSDPAIQTLRSELAGVTTQQALTQTSIADIQRVAASALETSESFPRQIASVRALVRTLEIDVDAMEARLANIPVQDEYDELKLRIDRINDAKNDLIGKMQTMSESSVILDRAVHRTIFAPPNPAITLLRRDLDAVIIKQEEIETKLAAVPRA